MFTLRSFFNWCVAENLCRRNPAIEVQLDRIDRKGRSRFADLDLAQRLIENAPTDDLRFVLFCGFHTGMRKLEMVEAVPDWFDLRAKTVEIRATATFRPKDRDARTVPHGSVCRFSQPLRPSLALRSFSRMSSKGSTVTGSIFREPFPTI
jgi:site-specific recombinase XerD